MSYSNVGGCEWSHMFNKQGRAECEKQYWELQQSKSQSDAMLAQAALEASRKKDKSWGAFATAGVVLASLVGIAVMVIIIRKSRKKK